MKFLSLISLIIVIIISTIGCDSTQSSGEFESAGAVGKLMKPGQVNFDVTDNKYTITGAGQNIWAEKDDFYFVWKKTTGDLDLSARIKWQGSGKHAHRKAGWMIRQSFDSDAAYVDVVIHGDSMIAMQYRKLKGGPTDEIKAPVKAPAKIYLEKTGDLYSISLEREDGIIIPVGSILNPMADTLYTGLVVCSHETGVNETAEFTDVTVQETKIDPDDERVIESSLETLNIDSGIRSLVYQAQQHFEAPNWSVDGKHLLFNSAGKLYTIPASGGSPQMLNSDFADNCNNDHGYSADGTLLAISHSPKDQSLIYTLPATGGTTKLVTKKGPSYWHGWSPDGKYLVYCAQRNGDYDVYRISVNGGREKRLTNAAGLDDGPEYSPDGKYIYFNSVRSGLMKIWRMDKNGKNQKQITTDTDYADWFAHPSPDGKWLVFISYHHEVTGHPPNKEVSLRLMDLSTGEIKNVARLFGGQGTINVPSWSPDSKSFAFVSYRQIISVKNDKVKSVGN